MSQIFSVNLRAYGKNGTDSEQFSILQQDVNFQQGSFVDQYTILYRDPSRRQFGLIKVRFSDFFEELLEFEVTAEDLQDSDKEKFAAVTWKFYDGFEANKTFYGDLNGLEMTKRIQKSQLTPKDNTDAARDDDEIAESEPNAGPFFIPITSAIAIRDRTSLRQATVLTDRPSLATAEYHNATIEIVHLSN